MRQGVVQIYFLLAVLLLPAVAQAQFDFTTNNGALTVTAYTGYEGDAVVIPASTNGYPVISIGDSAFYSNWQVTGVTIPNSVTSIGESAFNDCEYLTSIIIPDSVTNIGSSAFNYCIRLGSATIGHGLTTIGDHVFASCALNRIIIPDSVTTIGDYAFALGYAENSVIIPNSVTSIGSYAFYESGLADIMISDSITNIGQFAFYVCDNLTAINVSAGNTVYSSLNGVLFDKNQTTILQYPGGLASAYAIPGTVISIGQFAFAECSMASVTIPDSVTNIGLEAFLESNLGSVIIPDSVVSIGYGAFAVCNLTTITIPKSVISIGDYAFNGCYGLSAAYFQGNAPPDDGTVFDSSPTVVYYLSGTTGWGATFGGAPTALWNPTLQTTDGSFGVKNNQFGFNLTGTTNIPVRLEAATNLNQSSWSPLFIGTLTNGSLYFSDPNWTNYPNRFYRLRSP